MQVLHALTGNVNQSKRALLNHNILSTLPFRSKTDSWNDQVQGHSNPSMWFDSLHLYLEVENLKSCMFLFCYQLRALTHVYPYCVVTRALHVSRHVVLRSQKVRVIFLNACMRHHGDDCEWTMMLNALWVKGDDLPGSCVCKMHLCHAYHKHSLMHSLYFLQ